VPKPPMPPTIAATTAMSATSARLEASSSN
jgi:hypothetical protein